jgi:hypothetical protein
VVAPRFALIAFRGAEMKNPAQGRVLLLAWITYLRRDEAGPLRPR